MIYVYPSKDEPICQGDIFKCIPRIDVSLENRGYIKDGEAIQASWTDLVEQESLYNIEAVVSMRPVYAIVITQDCDAVRIDDIALCEVKDFKQVYPHIERMKETPKKWVGVITKKARVNLGWFYLPVDSKIGFRDKMGVDFPTVIRIGRLDLEKMKEKYRIARLNEVSLAHFRERVAEFFRRYPYDEWYPLTREELEAYRKEKPEPIEPYDWQK